VNGALDEARVLLGAWSEGLVGEDAVVTWADSVIADLPTESLPEWLLDLSMYGPARCMARPSSEFIHVSRLPFLTGLALRASTLNVEDAEAVRAFVIWASHACMGDDLDHPAVQFGYQLDHLWGDRERMDLAVQLVRSELHTVLGDLPLISEAVLGAVMRGVGKPG
jgi:hypothetical protein